MFKLLGPKPIALAAVAILQTAALGYIVYDRIMLLRHGQEIVTKVVPVDPRDLFRGDYVILSYGFSRQVPVAKDTRHGDVVYVALRQEEANGSWQAKAVTSRYPEKIEDGSIVLKGSVRNLHRRFNKGSPSPKADIDYGIERYFVPEGTGLAIEKAVREKTVEAVLAVGRKGVVAIKQLRVDGQAVATEPLL